MEQSYEEWGRGMASMDHDALTLPVDDDDGHPWICSCGAGDVEDSHAEACAQIEEHLSYYRLVQEPCAGLPRGQHWHELVTDLAHDLAGDPEWTRGGVTTDAHFAQARVLLKQVEPGATKLCDMCGRWERGRS